VIPQLAPGHLTWADVDPARHSFDSGSAGHVVRSLGPARHVPQRPDVSVADPAMGAWVSNEGRLWTDAMTHALIEHYGYWAVGWRWAHDEGEIGGGPVGNWCCPRDSIGTPRETLARVAAALCEWREWLEHLAGWFERYPLDLAAVADQRIWWERTARNLILQVVDRTGCGSGWHGHCSQVLRWFLSRWNVAPDPAGELVNEAIGGRFRSWVGPDTVLVDDIAERLALSLRASDGARPAEPAPDHLQRWLAVREVVPWQQIPDRDVDIPLIPARDGAVLDIHGFDAAVDAARAEGLLAALSLARADAARRAPLDFELLRRWQQHVLATAAPPEFRTLPAFAKGGRERYGISPESRDRLDACLAQSAVNGGSPLPVTARAARAYLDVCFFHPFEDGNARAAFLVLVFVLAREDIVLDGVSLLRRTSFHAGDPKHALALARYVDLHLTETLRTRRESTAHRR
jgi:Fic/DOC family protein